MNPDRLAAAGFVTLNIDGMPNYIDAATITHILPEQTFEQLSPSLMRMTPTNNIGGATIQRIGHAPCNVQHSPGEVARRVTNARLAKARLAAADIDNDKWDEIVIPEAVPETAGSIGV